MKNPLLPLLTVALAALSLLLSGCGGAGSKTKMDTGDLTKAFASADAALKGPVDEAAKALNGGKLFEGTTGLVNVVKSGGDKLTEEQKNALINVGATVQMVMSEDGDKADLKVYQAVEDLMAALDNRDAGKVGATPDRPVAPKAGK